MLVANIVTVQRLKNNIRKGQNVIHNRYIIYWNLNTQWFTANEDDSICQTILDKENRGLYERSICAPIAHIQKEKRGTKQREKKLEQINENSIQSD